MTVIDEIVVVVPANDEEALVGRSMTALDAAFRRYRRLASDDRTRLRVVVVLDACVDSTASIVREWPSVETVEVGYRNVGAARASGVGAAITESQSDPSRVWIANTDADSRVPADWIVRQLSLARAGSDVVVGSIRPDPGDLTVEQYRAWEVRARVEHAAGSAGDSVFGANLGVRADVYRAIGGFLPLPLGEDVDLVARARASGAKVVVSDACWVETSARTVGRARGGYAEFVRANY